MKIGIHHTKGSFSDRWITYCETNGIEYKIVNCYRSDILSQISDCGGLMWHFSQNSSKDFLFAKQLIYSIEALGKKVFPDFNTAWHFDDKVGQKYLLEAIGAPFVPSWVFYDKEEALSWIENTSLPKVFKLREGAGSQNVHLVESRKKARRLIKEAFGRGFYVYNPKSNLKERWRKYKLGKTSLFEILKGIGRLFIPPEYSIRKGRQNGYIYFQEFVSGNDFDIRVVVIAGKAFAIKRMVREDDFRASGSGKIYYDKELFCPDVIKLSFSTASKLKSLCVAFDFVFYNGNPLIIEISYGFSPEGYDPCPGYWDRSLKWHEGSFNPYGWMVDLITED